MRTRFYDHWPANECCSSEITDEDQQLKTPLGYIVNFRKIMHLDLQKFAGFIQRQINRLIYLVHPLNSRVCIEVTAAVDMIVSVQQH